jgi:hypothetical protein
MQYSNTTYANGIIQNIERYTDLGLATISGNTNLLKTITAYANEINKEAWFNIYSSTGNWIYDDSNATDLPQAVGNLVSGTKNYALPGDTYTNGTITTNGAITVKRIEIKDANGDWHKIKPISLEQINTAVDELYQDGGTPDFYRLLNNTIQLFPTPNYASTGGLKVYFDRSTVDFLYNDTTKTPGFASPFHDLISLGASIKWLKAKNPTNASLPIYLQDYDKMLANLIKFYQSRFKDKAPRVGRLKERWA